MKKLLLPLVLLALLLSAQTPKTYGQPQIHNPLWLGNIESYAENWLAPRMIYAYNSTGDSVHQYDVVTWDNAKTLVDSAARASACDTMTIADSLDTSHWWQFRVKTLNAATSCSLEIQGLDTNDVAQVDTVVVNGAANLVVYSSYSWRKINLLIWRNGAANDSLVLYGLPYYCVKNEASAADVDVAGVIYEDAGDDEWCLVVIQGEYKAKIIGATTEVTPGAFIQSSATIKYGQVNATPAVGTGLGTALEWGNTNKAYRIYISPAY